jgi:hypothetical protein
LREQVAKQDTGQETTLPELQRRCVLLVARDIAAHIEFPLGECEHLKESWCKMIRGLMHRVWAPAVRMVCQNHLHWKASGVDFKGKQLLDVCRVVLGSIVSIANSMPQAHTYVNKQQLCHELYLLTRLGRQRAEFDCEI